MDELDTQLANELAAQKEAPEEQKEGQEPVTGSEVKEEPKVQEAKTFSEEYVKTLRAENARYRIENRDMRSQQGRYPQEGYDPQGQYQQSQPIYDPRVDDMILRDKLSEIKADPDFSEIYNEVDEEGITFEERLLEKALDSSWPVSELDALALKMSKSKLFGKVRQKAIDETYKNISTKANTSAERNVSSGKNIEDSEVGSIEDAFERAKKELGVTDITKLR